MRYIFRTLLFSTLIFGNISLRARYKRTTPSNGQRLLKYCSSFDVKGVSRVLSKHYFSKEEIEESLITTMALKKETQKKLNDKYPDIECPPNYLYSYGPTIMLKTAGIASHCCAALPALWGSQYLLAALTIDPWLLPLLPAPAAALVFGVVVPFILAGQFLLWAGRKFSATNKVKARKLYKKIDAADDIIEILQNYRKEPHQLLTNVNPE